MLRRYHKPEAIVNWRSETGQSTPLLFDSDNRFMQGRYISVNGQEHEGTFGFI